MWRATTTFSVKRSDLTNETCHCYDNFRHPAGGHQDGPLALELSRRPGLNALCCVTAQHREMLDSVLNIFRLKPDYDLNIMEPRQTLSTITSKCLTGMDGVLEQAKPDLVLVHGDTSTTFAGALAAFYHKVPVGHVEGTCGPMTSGPPTRRR